MVVDLETTKTAFKNNIILRAHLEHSELWWVEDRQMGAGELARAPKASCFKRTGLISVFHPCALGFGNNHGNFQEQHYPAGAP